GGFEPRAEPVLGLSTHMSYPFIVDDGEDETYCVPETCLENEIALYRAGEVPERWSKVCVLVPDFPGVDPTVFRHDGRWWLTGTRSGPLEDIALWVWHADRLTGPWIEHPANPVKTDVRSARPGGSPFVVDGELYRPAQDCSTSYGAAVSIQRVTRLSITE